MSYRVVLRPEAGDDISAAAGWYEEQQSGLGVVFVEEVLGLLDALAENPSLNSRRHAAKNIRWRFPERFPYRVIYEIDEVQRTVIVACVLHAARHDRHWLRRV